MSNTLRMARPRAELVGGRADWYRMENIASTVAQVYIYSEIGYLGVTAADFVRDLNQVTASEIELHLNTPGGDVFDGIAIYNALKQHRAKVTVHVDALAASIGSVIAMAGDEVVMAGSSTMMIHEAFGMGVGDSKDMRDLADRLDQMSNVIAGIYAARSGGGDSRRKNSKPDYWRGLMKAETWMTDKQAVELGLADRVGDPSSNPQNSFDLSVFRKGPDAQIDLDVPDEDDPPQAPVARALGARLIGAI